MADKKIVATTVTHVDGFRFVAYLYASGKIETPAIIAGALNEGVGSYRLAAEEASDLAKRWNIDFAPNQTAAEMSMLEGIQRALAVMPEEWNFRARQLAVRGMIRGSRTPASYMWMGRNPK